MGALVGDLVGGVGGLILKKIENAQLMKWAALLLSCFFSAFIAFTGVLGLMLITKTPTAIAFGYALVSTAVVVLTVLTHDPRGRTLMLAIPKNIILAYQKAQAEGNTSIIEPSKK